MTVVLYGLASAIAALLPEYLYRTTTLSWWRLAPATVPCSVVISYCVCVLVRETESLPDAFIVFAWSTMVLRVLLTLFLGDRLSAGTWAGLALVSGARVLQGWLR